MFLLLPVATLSAMACPYDPAPAYLYNSVTNVTLSPGEWFYFYTDYILLGDTLTVRVAPAVPPVGLYLGDGLLCPDDQKDKPVLTVGQPGKFGKYTISVSDSLGVQLFGVRADVATDVTVSLEGGNPNNADLGTWVILSSLFLVFTVILLVVMFIHAILARARVHYEVDVTE
jgi:hypothetical protein